MPSTEIMNAELFIDSRCTLGEGIIWDEKKHELHWVDILEKKVHSVSIPRLTQIVTQYPETLGFISLSEKGDWILGMKDTIQIFAPGTTTGKILFQAPTDHPANRFNDGKCSPDGRIIAGTMDMNEKEPNGQLYQVKADGSKTVLRPAVTISNGLAWNIQKKLFYYIDTPSMTVQRASYDPATGEVGPFSQFIHIPQSIGFPDGMTIDSQGNLYIAMWQGHAVTIWDGESGESRGSINVPALNVTCPVFGGEEMDELFITSARIGMNDEQLKKYPLSGGVFKVKLGVKGIAGSRFKAG